MAIDLLTKHIQRQLQERKMQSRWDMARICPPQELPPNVVVLEETKQIKACHAFFSDEHIWKVYFATEGNGAPEHAVLPSFHLCICLCRVCTLLFATLRPRATTLSFTLIVLPLLSLSGKYIRKHKLRRHRETQVPSMTDTFWII